MYTFNQDNAYDLGMVVGFLGALVVQAVATYRLTRAPRGPLNGTAPRSTGSSVSERPRPRYRSEPTNPRARAVRRTPMCVKACG